MEAIVVVIQRKGILSTIRRVLPVLLLLPLLALADEDKSLAVAVTGGDASRVAYFTGKLSGMLGEAIRMVPPDAAEVRVALDRASFRAARSAGVWVLGVNVPRSVVAAARAEGCRCSALLPGADPKRQLRLMQLLQPGVQRVGVLSTPASGSLREELLVAARDLSLELDLVEVSGRKELAPALSRLLPRVDALLALERSGLYGPDTARLVLLTSYRQRRPVVGPNRAFVRAGSLATTYSGDDHRARSIADWLRLLHRGEDLPEPDWPNHFAVTLNEHVARAYDLAVRDPQWLAAELRDKEAR